MTDWLIVSPRYFKPSAFFSLALCISAAAHGRVLLPDESVTVSQGAPPENWGMATGATLTVNGGAQILDVGGSGASTLILNAGSTAGRIFLDTGSTASFSGASVVSNTGSPAFQANGTTATLIDTVVTSTSGIGIFGTQAVGGPGSALTINGGAISGATGGLSLSVGGVVNAAGTAFTGTGANSFGVQAFNSNMSFRDSVLTGGLNGLLYQGSPGASGVVELDNSRVEGASGGAIQVNGRRAPVDVVLNLRNGTTLTGGNGNALEVANNATATVLLQNSAVNGNVVISNGSTTNLNLDRGQLTGDITADSSSIGTLAMSNGSLLTGNVNGLDAVTLDASTLIGDVASSARQSTLVLSNRSVLNGSVSGFDTVSLTASAMLGTITAATPAAVVALREGSALEGNVIGSDHVSLDASSMTGNITSGSTAGKVTLSSGSSLTGNVTGSDSVSLDGSSIKGNVASATGAGLLFLRAGATLDGDVASNNVSIDASAMKGDITSTAGVGQVALTGGSLLIGDVTGNDSINLDRSSIRGNVFSATSAGLLSLQNGSTVEGNVSSNNVSLNASTLTGNITSLDGTGVVSLENESAWTGNLVNVNRLTVGDPSVWTMNGSNTVNTLVMNEGVVRFGEVNQFYQLDVGNLSGNGTFIMDADYTTNQHDLLNVTGSATGNHTLQIAGSGVDPVSPVPLNIVHTAGGDATFALAGGRPVDVGTYSYQLASSANSAGGSDWYLDPTNKTISPGTASVLALFNTAPTVWYGELTSLRSRMGELRFNGGQAGGWVRAYGNKYNVDEASGVGYKQTQQGFSLGADAPLPVGDGQWLVGVLAGHSASDLSLNYGTSGTVKSYYVGAYTTWLDQETGYYFDGVLKLNRFRNDSKVSMSDGTRAKGDYDNVGVGGSVEFGRHIKLDDGYFVEPFTQLSTVVIQGKDYGLNNGMQAEGDRTRSLLGKVGVTTGRNFTLKDGKVVQPYVRVAGVHEFAKSNKVRVNNNVFNNDLSGSRGELGAGVAVAFSDKLQLHADFDYATGQHIEQPFGANVGLRFSW